MTSLSEHDSGSLLPSTATASAASENHAARGHNNHLGFFLRQRRKALGKTLAQIASDCNYSLSLLSKAELGQLPEGPTLKLLERLAKSLGVDVTKLVQLKEEDTSAARVAFSNVSEGGSTAMEAERQMMHNFRALDDRLQQNLLGQAQLIRGLQEGGWGGADVSAVHAEDVPTRLPTPPEPLPEQLARNYEAIGRQYHALKWFGEAIKNYDSALAIYGQMGRPRAAARMWFHKGCILNHLSRYSEGEGADQQQKPRLDGADACFDCARRLFSEAEANKPGTPLLDDEKEYVPENLRHWAINDMQLARILAQEDDISPEYHVAMMRHFLGKAERKQDASLKLFMGWIEELEGRLEGLRGGLQMALADNNTSDNDSRDWDRVLELLAEAFHRKGLLHSNIAAEQIRFLDVLGKYEADKRPYVKENNRDKENRDRKAVAASDFCRSSFLQAIRLRRDLALTAPSQEDRDRNLSNLANSHQALAYAAHNYSRPAIPRDQYEYALYHYLLAEKIDALIPARGNTGQRDDPGQREAIHLHSTTLERDSPLGEDMRVAIRRRVEAYLDGIETGTRERPVLRYEVDYPLAESAT